MVMCNFDVLLLYMVYIVFRIVMFNVVFVMCVMLMSVDVVLECFGFMVFIVVFISGLVVKFMLSFVSVSLMVVGIIDVVLVYIFNVSSFSVMMFILFVVVSCMLWWCVIVFDMGDIIMNISVIGISVRFVLMMLKWLVFCYMSGSRKSVLYMLNVMLVVVMMVL